MDWFPSLKGFKAILTNQVIGSGLLDKSFQIQLGCQSLLIIGEGQTGTAMIEHLPGHWKGTGFDWFLTLITGGECRP